MKLSGYTPGPNTLFRGLVRALCASCLLLFAVGFVLCTTGFVLCTTGCSSVGPDGEESAEPRNEIADRTKPLRTPLLFLGPEDIIRVRIWPQKDLDRTVRTDRQGYINLPLAGRVNVAGQNLDWLRYVLFERYGKYYNDFDIMVDLIESPLQKAFVLGEVNMPGSYPISGATSVLDLISQAKGFTGDADLDSVVLVRGDINVPRVIPVDLEAALDGDLSQDYCLVRGDIVYVNRTFIADLEDFGARLVRIILPVYQTQRALIMGAMVPDAVMHGETRTKMTIGGDDFLDPTPETDYGTLPRSYRYLRELREQRREQ